MSNRNKLGFGIVGCSNVAVKSVMPSLLSSGLAEIAAIGSRSRDKALSLGKIFSCDSCGSYEDVITHPDVDVVYISLPNLLHEEWTIRAAREGKHVLCEKPASCSLKSVNNMLDACKRNSVRLLEGFMFQYHPQHAKVRQMVREGCLGRLLRFEGVFGFPFPDRDKNLLKKECGGGALNDSLGYPVFASRMVFGEEPQSVVCHLETDPHLEIDAKADMMLCFSEGKVAFVSSAFGSYFQSHYTILGSRACVKVKRAYAVPRDLKTTILVETNDQSEEILVEPADHFRIMIDDFCNTILKKTATNYEENLLAQARIMEAGRISNCQGRVVGISELM